MVEEKKEENQTALTLKYGKRPRKRSTNVHKKGKNCKSADNNEMMFTNSENGKK